MHLGPDFGNQATNAEQVDRRPSGILGPPKNVPQLSAPPGQSSFLVPGEIGALNQPAKAAAVIFVI